MFPRLSIKKRLYEATQVVEPFGLYILNVEQQEV